MGIKSRELILERLRMEWEDKKKEEISERIKKLSDENKRLKEETLASKKMQLLELEGRILNNELKQDIETATFNIEENCVRKNQLAECLDEMVLNH